jgi:hypothetical protein
MNARRNYSDAQWLRLAGAVEARPARAARSPRRRANIAFFAVLAPIAAAAAFLYHPRHDGRAVQAASGGSEAEMKLSVRSVVASAYLMTAAAQGQNLLQNGGLEGPAGGCAHFFVDPGSSQIPGWIVSGSWNVDWMRNSGSACVCPYEGSYFVDLNGSPSWVSGSAIQQNIATVQGRRYVLRLRAVPNDYTTPLGTVKVLRLTTGQAVTDVPLTTVEFSCPGPWLPIQVPFVASSTQTVIELRSTFPDNAGGILVDDVSVVEVSCPGDITRNGTVDGVDLALVLSTWGTNGAQGAVNCDLNNDGVVDGMDLATVLGGWGACP